MATENNAQQPGTDGLQFDRAEFDKPKAGAGNAACAFCKKAIPDQYYEINGKITCALCKDRVEKAMTGGSGAKRFFKATIFGILAGAVGAALWYAILRFTGYEVGLIAIVVGFLVGFAVRKGSEGRGGWAYQALAMFITYSSIVVTYIPFIIQGSKGYDIPAVVLFGIALAAPVLAGFKNIIGILIIGFAVYQAWHMNKRVAIQITGPYNIAGAALPTSAPPPGGT